MARTNTDDPARNGSRSSTSARSRRRTDCVSLPFSSHPLYQLRRAIIIFAVIGALLCFLGASYWGPYYGASLQSNFILLSLSAFLCALDLICYASRKKDNPDEEPERPNGKWTLVDLIMAVLLQFVFWTSLAALNDYYRYDYYNVLGLYGILGSLVCSILHAWCFWKQLMDHKKQNWLSKMEKQPCARCGYTEEQNDPPTPDHRHDGERANIFPYAGPSADLGRANVMTPESPESAMEEGLLIGSDFGSDYGSVKRTEPVLEPPKEIVVGKGKKKIRSGSSQKGSAKGSTS